MTPSASHSRNGDAAPISDPLNCESAARSCSGSEELVESEPAGFNSQRSVQKAGLSVDEVALIDIREELRGFVRTTSDPTPIAAAIDLFVGKMHALSTSSFEPDHARIDQLWTVALRDVLQEEVARCPLAFRTDDGATYFMDEYGSTIKIAHGSLGELNWSVLPQVVFTKRPPQLSEDSSNDFYRSEIAEGVFPVEARSESLSVPFDDDECSIKAGAVLENVSVGRPVLAILRADEQQISKILREGQLAKLAGINLRDVGHTARAVQLSPTDLAHTFQFFRSWIAAHHGGSEGQGELASLLQIGLPDKIAAQPSIQIMLDSIVEYSATMHQNPVFAQAFATRFARPSAVLPEHERVGALMEWMNDYFQDSDCMCIASATARLRKEFPEVVRSVLADQSVFDRLVQDLDREIMLGRIEPPFYIVEYYSLDSERLKELCRRSMYVSLVLPYLNLEPSLMQECLELALDPQKPPMEQRVIAINAHCALLLANLIADVEIRSPCNSQGYMRYPLVETARALYGYQAPSENPDFCPWRQNLHRLMVDISSSKLVDMNDPNFCALLKGYVKYFGMLDDREIFELFVNIWNERGSKVVSGKVRGVLETWAHYRKVKDKRPTEILGELSRAIKGVVVSILQDEEEVLSKVNSPFDLKILATGLGVPANEQGFITVKFVKDCLAQTQQRDAEPVEYELEGLPGLSLVKAPPFLKVLSGYISRTCYAKGHIAEAIAGGKYENLDSFIFVSNRGGVRRAHGNLLLVHAIEAETGSRVVAFRAVNPSESLIRRFGAESVVKSLVTFGRTVKAELSSEILGASTGDALSNRPAINAVFMEFYGNGASRLGLVSAAETFLNFKSTDNPFGDTATFMIRDDSV